jgi:hypothetical protein
MGMIYRIVAAKMPMQNSNRFIKLNSRKKGRLPNTQNLMITGRELKLKLR